MLNRRSFTLGLASTALPRPSWSAGKPRIVIVGAGIGGLSALQRLRRLTQDRCHISMVEARPDYVVPVTAHRILSGQARLGTATLNYRPDQADRWLLAHMVGLQAQRQQLLLSSGERIGYDYLLLSPGLECRGERPARAWLNDGSLPDWIAGLNGLPDKVEIVLTAPSLPHRCPPAPYERASLLMHFLLNSGRDVHLSLLDAKERFSQQAQFLSFWEQRWPGRIEWLPPSVHEGVQAVSTRSVETGFGSFEADWVEHIPAQQAPTFCREAGLADFTGFCPVELPSFRSQRHDNIYIIGDAAKAGEMPKSASAASSQAQHAVHDLLQRLQQGAPEPATGLNSVCFSRLDGHHAVSSRSRYSERGTRLDESLSAYPMDRAQASDEFIAAERWYQDMLTGLGLASAI